MAIDYLAIRDTNRDIIGIVDTAQSVIWHKKYFGVGDFEIYVQATEKNIDLLRRGNYVCRLNDDEIGIVESVNIVFDIHNGKMITARGRFAKSILDRRLIYRILTNWNKPVIINGNVESAARGLVAGNMISCAFDSRRNVGFLRLGDHSGSTETLSENRQISYKNLLEYTDELLREFGLSANITLEESTKNLLYKVFSGVDRTVDNAAGNDPVIFSVDYDNFTNSDFTTDESTLKNCAIIGGEGEGTNRFDAVLIPTETGINRRETFVDASSVSRTYRDGDGDDAEEQEYTPEQYRKMLIEEGKTALVPLAILQKYAGTIVVNFGNWQLNRDFFIGDMVTIQDTQIGIYANVRIVETTEIQDENGYNIEAKYE